MPTSREILDQLASDLEELARRLQSAIEASRGDSAEIARLTPIRDKAFRAALLARQALDGLPPDER